MQPPEQEGIKEERDDEKYSSWNSLPVERACQPCRYQWGTFFLIKPFFLHFWWIKQFLNCIRPLDWNSLELTNHLLVQPSIFNSSFIHGSFFHIFFPSQIVQPSYVRPSTEKNSEVLCMVSDRDKTEDVQCGSSLAFSEINHSFGKFGSKWGGKVGKHLVENWFKF